MIGKKINVVSYSGLDKDTWIECQDYLQSQRTIPVSTFINIDMLRRSSKNFIELLEKNKGTIIPGKFVDIGVIDF